MIKSVKGLFILSVITAILFITNTFSYIEFTGKTEFQFPRIVMYFASFLAVYNAGILTQKYIQTRSEK
ncbi:MAG TPA: hypothetical protein IAA78_04120 [Candidatus Avamphibacillus intestinigallinarum]|nr:hypothetical protein [Candidatus Avamphibacillus intestinigallinarum]